MAFPSTHMQQSEPVVGPSYTFSKPDFSNVLPPAKLSTSCGLYNLPTKAPVGEVSVQILEPTGPMSCLTSRREERRERGRDE